VKQGGFIPNHCSNILRIKGPKDRLEEFKKYAEGPGPKWDSDELKPDAVTAFDINKFVPVPLDILNAKKNNRADAFNSGGYEWCVANWGTKWGVYDIQVNFKGGGLEYIFSTAWAPFSVNVIEAMAALYPELSFELKYGESGMGFGGIMAASDGEVQEDDYYEDAFKKAKRDPDFEYLMGSPG
jgi:hypothetical protein